MALAAGWGIAMGSSLVSRWLDTRATKSKQPEAPRIFEGLPLQRCRYVGRSVTFWCPYCQVNHYHRWEPEDTRGIEGKQYRTAHCKPNSPFHDGGYEIFVPVDS